ncbi:MAG TPA: serine hydrolase domain-containing protein [Methanotrichaceae archaeon]|nr:serine hydrolase domain-containing protein [Methanotrichaceae archaeon]
MRGIEILCTVLMAALIAPSASASNVTDFSPLDKAIQEELKVTNTPGCAVAIISDNKVVYAKGFGVANVESGQPVTPETLFLIGSTTKAFTAYTVLSLAEGGKVDINKPAGNYIEGMSPRLSNVTVHQLLSHTAGLKELSWPDDIKWDVESGLEERIRSFNDTLFFSEPGDVFSYSNEGFSLAGYLAQTVGGTPYSEAVAERVLKPVGMNNSTFYLETAVTHPMAVGHAGNASEKLTVMRPFEEYAYLWPAGFLFSNVQDMARFATALMNNGTLDGKQVLSSSIIKEMFTPHADLVSIYPGGSYGYGMMLHDYRGVDVVEHGGNQLSFTCVFKMVPEHKFALIILNNGVSREMPNSTRKAFEMMLPLKPEVVETPQDMNESEMARYVGNYSQDPQHPENATGVIVKDGKLMLKSSSGHEMSIENAGKDLFTCAIPGNPDPMYIGFVPGKDGRIKYLHIGLRAAPKIEA